MLNRLREWVIDWLIERALPTPYYHIYSGGTLYMQRWWLVRPRRWLPFSVRIHRIVRSDADRHLHDHPFDFATLILRGGYYEELPLDQRQHPVRDEREHEFLWRGAGDVVVHRSTDRHRIHIPPGGEAWTLFFMGRRQQSWGFYTAAGKVYWREYLNDYTTVTVSDDA